MRYLVGLLATLVLTLCVAGASVAAPPGSGYAWAQPGTASVATFSVQPPAWIFAFVKAPAPPVLSSYAWSQPGTAPVSTPFAQPPAWIPIYS